MIKFEIGKFYKVQINGFCRKKIPAICIRVTKCTVSFQYLSRSDYEGIHKSTVQMRKRVRADWGKEIAYDPGIWSMISDTAADELCDKPKMWEDVK